MDSCLRLCSSSIYNKATILTMVMSTILVSQTGETPTGVKVNSVTLSIGVLTIKLQWMQDCSTQLLVKTTLVNVDGILMMIVFPTTGESQSSLTNKFATQLRLCSMLKLPTSSVWSPHNGLTSCAAKLECYPSLNKEWAMDTWLLLWFKKLELV
jgi:hypothetical protein